LKSWSQGLKPSFLLLRSVRAEARTYLRGKNNSEDRSKNNSRIEARITAETEAKTAAKTEQQQNRSKSNSGDRFVGHYLKPDAMRVF
jgi:hypothetical protein